MDNKKKIVIVDDDQKISSLLQELLAGQGFDTQTTNHPKEVVPLIKAYSPDLILLDLLMPNLGGFEICELLNKDPHSQGIPIIVISGLIDAVDIKRAYKLGVVSYFTKPLNLQDLVKEINKALAYKENR
jgi:CheY-like chemotaxis protein